MMAKFISSMLLVVATVRAEADVTTINDHQEPIRSLQTSFSVPYAFMPPPPVPQPAPIASIIQPVMAPPVLSTNVLPPPVPVPVPVAAVVTCGEGQVFNPTFNTCFPAPVPVAAPVATIVQPVGVPTSTITLPTTPSLPTSSLFFGNDDDDDEDCCSDNGKSKGDSSNCGSKSKGDGKSNCCSEGKSKGDSNSCQSGKGKGSNSEQASIESNLASAATVVAARTIAILVVAGTAAIAFVN